MAIEKHRVFCVRLMPHDKFTGLLLEDIINLLKRQADNSQMHTYHNEDKASLCYDKFLSDILR
ncbi:hypothetical protein C3B55_00746 [Candidatus Pseudomonas adelgestsugas]|uniref:Uncharacterized protein n=1 Tax=Candidatus Pseudomonas adelgestsugas TaxID=1302376 RepID=A0ABX5R9G4_9PSED|nr:hypothetical protein C3B55_00746 [Candidatus Pseudomonas adelgestsugas]